MSKKGGAMRVHARIHTSLSRVRVGRPLLRGRLLVVAALLMLVAATPAAGDHRVAAGRQTAIAHFHQQTIVWTEILEGSYLIVHDDTRMSTGEPCTVIYRLDPMGKAREEAVSFHCIPSRRPMVDHDKVTTRWDRFVGMNTMIEYQFAGDTEGHGVPSCQMAANGLRSGVLVVPR